MQLTHDGQALTCISIPENASIANRFAADELSKYLQQITGVKFAIKEGCCCCDTGCISVKPACSCAGLKNDGYYLKTEGNNLTIAGENDRGIVYGVYGFLEKAVGCRFLAFDTEVIPSIPDLIISDLDETVISPFEYRETSWQAMQDNDIAFKRGINGAFRGDCDERGGSIKYWLFCHTLYSYVDPEEYFDEHPEYFSMISGQRIRFRPQLCLTNPDVIAITQRKLRQNIIDHPDCKIFSLTQMDWYNPCECPECAKVDAEEGSHAGTMIRFVNACADFVAEEFPDVIIDTFAYQYTRQPAGITKPHSNVAVRICSIECCFTHPIKDCQKVSDPFCGVTIPGITFKQDMEGWGKICQHFHIWDYTTNFRFYLAPMINLHVLQSNIQYFLANHVTGLFEQGNGQSISGEFGELRAYLLTKLMWEPDGDVSAWRKDFLDGYYGKGGCAIGRYIDMLAEHVTRYNIHGGIYENPMHLIQDALLPAIDALWDEAEAASAGDEKALAHIQRSRMQVKFTKLHRKDGKDDDYSAMAEDLIADIERFGLTYVQEAMDLKDSIRQIRENDLPDTWKTFFRGRGEVKWGF